jgi:hypothetical protein
MPNSIFTDPNYSSSIFTPSAVGASASGPAYERISSIPSWLPREGNQQLLEQYGNIGKDFSTEGYDKESRGQQSRVLTTALNAGNNAAAEYANRARQQGGSAFGAGLVKAQAQVGAQKTAGDMALEREKFDASQREKAAGLASQIASTLGNLRDSYLKSIVSYATSEDQISADYSAKMAAVDASRKGSGNEPPPPNSFTPGYVPTFGPITQATVNGQTVPNAAFGSVPNSWWQNYGMGHG